VAAKKKSSAIESRVGHSSQDDGMRQRAKVRDMKTSKNMPYGKSPTNWSPAYAKNESLMKSKGFGAKYHEDSATERSFERIHGGPTDARSVSSRERSEAQRYGTKPTKVKAKNTKKNSK
jgi:hypothetical protein